jgi:hypothetical protein
MKSQVQRTQDSEQKRAWTKPTITEINVGDAEHHKDYHYPMEGADHRPVYITYGPRS